MSKVYRPVKEHECNESKGYCSICVAHALDPSSIVGDDTPTPFLKFMFGLLMITVIAWAIGCADFILGSQAPTHLEEIHNEYQAHPPEQNFKWGSLQSPTPNPTPRAEPTPEDDEGDEIEDPAPVSAPTPKLRFEMRKLVTKASLKKLRQELGQ